MLVTGFGTAVAMWAAWYVLHMPGVEVPGAISTPLLGVLLVAGCGFGAFAARRGWVVGLLAGLVAAAVNLLLLGSRVVVQPTSTETLAANELRPDAAAIVLGFLAASAAAGAAAGWVAARLAARRSPLPGPANDASGASPADWLGRFAAVLAFAIVPLVVAGGLVTSTESGMAVPDSVTTYGSISFLFPLSLMAEPRVFFEHTHRLFGTLVGVTAIVLAAWSVARQRAWAIGAGGLAAVALLAAILGGELASRVPTAPAIAAVVLISAVGLALTTRAILRTHIALAGVGMLVLVVGQGLLGALRVSEISTPLAMVHGVFAQLVLACAAAMAAAINRGPPLPPHAETDRAFTQARPFARWAVAAIVLQLILGAGYRHTASHAFLAGHILFALAVASLVLLLGMSLRRADPATRSGKWARRRGMGLIHLIIIQLALGIVSVILVVTRDADRPIPSAAELASAHPIPKLEAAFTTAHQATGAALLALTAAALVRTRPERPASP